MCSCSEPVACALSNVAAILRNRIMRENGDTAVFMTDSIGEALAIGGRIAVPGRPATPAYDVGALRTGTRALRAPAAL